MKFSTMSLFSAITGISLIIGTLLSRNVLLIEIVQGVVFVFLVISFGLAMWDRKRHRRMFWTGYFAGGIATVLFGVLNLFSTTSEKGAYLFATPQRELYPIGEVFVEGDLMNREATSIGSTNQDQQRRSWDTVTVQEFDIISRSIPFFLSVVSSIGSGWLTYFLCCEHGQKKP